MKNNKGFTLTELLATILVLAIVISLTISTVLGVIDDAKAKSYRTTISNIEKTALIYLKENSDKISFVDTAITQYQCIKVKHLIDSGYFDNEILKSKISEDKNVDPEMYVYVSRNLETKVITGSQLTETDPSLKILCDNINGSLGKKIEFEYTRGWSKTKVIEIIYTLSNVTDSKQIKNYNYSYSVTGSSKVENSFTKQEVSQTITITKPSTIVATIDNTEDSNPYSKSINISKIDSLAPKVNPLPGDTKYEKGKSITVTIEDISNDESGASGFNPSDTSLTVKYGWSTSKTVEPTTYSDGTLTYTNCNGSNTECTKAEFQAVGDEITGDYYLWVIPNMQDIAGNEVEKAVSTGTYKFDNKNPVVNISRKDYNTFDCSESTDNIGITNYHINTTGTVPDNTSVWVNTETYDIDSANTYYVWARDEAGNISDVKSIRSFKVTRTQGTGTTLKTLFESSTGTEFTDTTYVLSGTPIYISGTANSGYSNLSITYNGETITSGTAKILLENAEIKSSAQNNNVIININKDNSAWTNSGMKVALYKGTTQVTETVTAASNSQVSFTSLASDTYRIYATNSQSSNLIDTGIDMIVSGSSTTSNINYYTLTINKGTGIDSVSGAGIYLMNQSINIKATALTGYGFSSWVTTSGNTPTSITSASTTIKVTQTTSLSANAKDIIAPTVSYTAFYAADNSTYTSGTWTNKQVYTTISAVDSGSGVAYIQYILKSTYDANNSATWSTFNFSVSSLTKNGTTWKGTEPWNLITRNQEYYFRACDKDGNCTAKDNFANWNIRYDLTAPSVPTYIAYHASDNSSYTSGTWTNNRVLTKISSTDSDSGVAKIQYILKSTYDANNNATWNTFSFAESKLSNSGTKWSGVEGWSVSDGRNQQYYFRACDTLENCSGVSSVYHIKYDTSAPTPIITISDCDTFTYSASDTTNASVTGYYVSTTNTTPSLSQITETATSKSFTVDSLATTYYVWAKDEAGNISSVATKPLVKLTRSQGDNTTLTTRYNSTSSSTGTVFSSNIYVLPGDTCKVWASASANDGYTAELAKDSSTLANPSSTTVTAATTIKSTAIPKTITINYVDNRFNTDSSKTINDLTYTYDSSTYYLTLDGTTTTRFDFQAVPYKFVSGETYNIKLTYISGSYTASGSYVFVTEPKKTGGLSLSTRNYKDITLPTSGTSSGTLTITDVGANEGELLHNWLWLGSGASLTFADYVIEVEITPVNTQTKTYGNTLSTLPTPTRTGYTFNGWYTAKSGGTKITSTTAVPPTDTTYYARWISTPEIKTIYDIWGTQEYWFHDSLTSDVGVLPKESNKYTSQGTDSTWTTVSSDPYFKFNDLSQFDGIVGAYVELSSALSSDMSIQIFYEETGISLNEEHSTRSTLKAGSTKVVIMFKDIGEWTHVRFDLGGSSNPTFKIKSLGIIADDGQWNNNDILLYGTTSSVGSGISYWQYSYDKSDWTTYSSSASNDYATSPFTTEMNKTVYLRACDSSVCSPASSGTTVKIDLTKPDLTLSRTDYNTFSYSATDTSGITGYYTSEVNTSKAPTINSSWNSTISKDISSAGTYYVWAKDKAGNISDVKSITAYTISRSQGSNTTLTTRYDSTSSSTGTPFTSNMVMLAGTNVWASASATTGYSATLTRGGSSITNPSYIAISANTTFASTASDIEKPTTPSIKITDCDTFTYSATDTEGVTGYYVSTSSDTPSATASGWVTSTTYNISSLPTTATTYYVWAKDGNNNISEKPASITLVPVTRSQGSNTTLTTRYNSTSSSTGTPFTSSIYVLPDDTCNVWASASANSGYHNVSLTRNGSTVNNPSYASVTTSTAIASTNATANTAVITINKNGAAYSGLTVALYQSGTNKYTSPTYSSGVYTFSEVVNGTYDIYVGGSNTGKTVTVSNTGTATLNYYTILTTLPKDGSISKVNVSKEGPYLSGTTITITAVVNSGYTFNTWSVGANGILGNASSASTTLTINGQVGVTPSATANNYTVTFEGNKFSTTWTGPTIINGLTFTYDPDTSYLTINGTPTTQSVHFAYLPNSLVSGEQYKFRYYYISGSYTGSCSPQLEVRDTNKARLSTQNTAGTGCPTSSTTETGNTLTISDLGATNGAYLDNWFWFNSLDGMTFNNYVVKIVITKVETKDVKYNSSYGTDLPTPIRTAHTFNGWYTAESGGTAISDIIASTAANHTVYAHWTKIPITLSNVSISGNPLVGNTLTASATASTTSSLPTTISYTWYSKTTDGITTNIGTGSTYTLTSNERGKYIFVVVNATNENAFEASAISSDTSIVEQTYTHTATFNANGATITHNDTTSDTTIIESCTVTTTASSGSCTVLTPTITPPANYKASGWVDASDSSKTYDEEESIILTEDKIFNPVLSVVDTEGPIITVSDFCININEVTEENLKKKATITDVSGVNDDKTIVSPISLSFGSNNVKYYAEDIYGNSSEKTITVTVYKQIIDDISVVTSGDGLYEDVVNDGRYIYRGANPNNYITFNGQTWRIISIEADGTYKIIYTGTDIQQPYHSSSSGVSTFTDTTINTYLNETYYSTLNETVQNQMVKHSFNAGTVNIDRTYTGAYLSDIISDEDNTTVTMNVGLMNLSDYFKAALAEKCYTGSTAINSLYSGCMSNNWMNIGADPAQYTMTSWSDSRMWHIEPEGSASYAGSLWNATTVGTIRPVVYLSVSTTVTGSGTSSDPYVINSTCSSSSSYTCTISTTSGYVNPQTLTINAYDSSGTKVTSSEVDYSFNGSTYSSTNTKSVSSAGTYVAYIRDSSGLTNSCSITLNSQQQWRSATCAVDVSFGSWNYGSPYYDWSCSSYSGENNTWRRVCTGSYQGSFDCVVVDDAPAETNIYSSQSDCNAGCDAYVSQYRRDCDDVGSTISCNCKPEIRIDSRNCSCSSWGVWSNWGTTELSSSCNTKVEAQTAYGE